MTRTLADDEKREQLADSIQHRVRQTLGGGDYVVMPRDWMEQAAALLRERSPQDRHDDQRGLIAEALAALESDATAKQREEAFDKLRDHWFPKRERDAHPETVEQSRLLAQLRLLLTAATDYTPEDRAKTLSEPWAIAALSNALATLRPPHPETVDQAKESVRLAVAAYAEACMHGDQDRTPLRQTIDAAMDALIAAVRQSDRSPAGHVK